MVDLLAWPVRMEGGRLATVTAGSAEEATQDVEVLIATRVGERAAVPAFGTPDPVGVREIDTQAILDAAHGPAPGADRGWCPHSEIVSIEVAYGEDDPMQREVDVKVRRR